MTQFSLPSCDGFAFISYALADDQKLPFEHTIQGWVTFFWQQKRFELTNRSPKQAEPWLDRYQIKPANACTSKIKMALAQTRLIIAILFKNWAQNDWYQREVEIFGRIHFDTCDLVTSVFNNKLKRERLRLLTQGHQARKSYRFSSSYAIDKTHNLYWREHHELEEIHGGDISDLYQWLHQRLKPTAEAPDNQHSEKFNRMLVAATQTDEEELAIALTILVQGYGLSIQSYFPEDFSSLALNQHIVLILWGATNDTDLQSILCRLTLSAPTIFLHLPGGNKTTKRRFCQKNILLKKIDTLPHNWPQTRKLQVSLDMLPLTGDEP